MHRGLKMLVKEAREKQRREKKKDSYLGCEKESAETCRRLSSAFLELEEEGGTTTRGFHIQGKDGDGADGRTFNCNLSFQNWSLMGVGGRIGFHESEGNT